jgi:hypothetical protein
VNRDHRETPDLPDHKGQKALEAQLDPKVRSVQLAHGDRKAPLDQKGLRESPVKKATAAPAAPRVILAPLAPLVPAGLKAPRALRVTLANAAWKVPRVLPVPVDLLVPKALAGPKVKVAPEAPKAHLASFK